jgi:hypothetical protein
MARRGFTRVVVYLDDFLVVADTLAECIEAQNVLLALLRSLGFAIAWDKVEGPATELMFLGVEIDSVAGEFRLPVKKLEKFKELVSDTMLMRQISLKRLQALAGKLNWASSVVRGGRTYLRRILDIIKPLKHANHKLLITTDMRDDLRWWQAFLVSFNGKKAICVSRPETMAMVDACERGGGLVWGSDWRYVEWRFDFQSIRECHINVKELAAIVLAVRRWGLAWRGCRVVIWTDNTTAMYAMNKGTSKNRVMMALLREVFWMSCVFDIEIQCRHIAGVENWEADCVSRLFENGRLFQLEALLGFRTPLFYVVWPVAFLLHMSFKSFLSLVPQILRWLSSGNSYAIEWLSANAMPGQSRPGSRTSPFVSRT